MCAEFFCVFFHTASAVLSRPRPVESTTQSSYRIFLKADNQGQRSMLSIYSSESWLVSLSMASFKAS